jgi:hypothetical protein
VGYDPQVADLVLIVDDFEGFCCCLKLRHNLFLLETLPRRDGYNFLRTQRGGFGNFSGDEGVNSSISTRLTNGQTSLGNAGFRAHSSSELNRYISYLKLMAFDIWEVIASVATVGTLLVLLPSTIDTLYIRFF